MEDKSGYPEERSKARSIPVNIKHSPSSQQASLKTNQKTLVDYVPPSMEDPKIDKIIDDIIMSEGSEVLAAEDSMKSSNTIKRPKKKNKLQKIIKNKWFYIIVALILAAMFIIPFSRYLILGSFIKNNYQLTLIDSLTDKPVSDVTINISGSNYQTNALGQANMRLNVGRHEYRLSKQYYAPLNGYIFVGFASHQASTIKLRATGRQVPITIINKLTGKPIAGAKIAVLKTDAITNNNGQAQIVLPTKKSSYVATISDNGYNSISLPIQVTTAANVNLVGLVPSGYIYYLSNTTGTINVIKANLDGSNPMIELAGTGLETNSTTLIPSPDWQYLVLEAVRSGNNPGLYVINTATGNIDEFESSADNFQLIGWSGDNFIYDETSLSDSSSMIGREQIKSYDALNNRLNIIDQNQVVGSAPSYAYQSFSNFQLLANLLVYSTTWTSVNGYSLSSQTDTIRGVNPDGLDKIDYTTFPAQSTQAINIVRNLPLSLYISMTSNNQTSYYSFTNGAINPVNISQSTFSSNYPTYYLSPSGSETLWQNNQNQIFVGNQSGQNSKQLIFPNGYNLSGWYDNTYLLLQKNNQLFIAPASGSNKPTLIGNYFSPS